MLSDIENRNAGDFHEQSARNEGALELKASRPCRMFTFPLNTKALLMLRQEVHFRGLKLWRSAVSFCNEQRDVYRSFFVSSWSLILKSSCLSILDMCQEGWRLFVCLRPCFRHHPNSKQGASETQELRLGRLEGLSGIQILWGYRDSIL